MTPSRRRGRTRDRFRSSGSLHLRHSPSAALLAAAAWVSGCGEGPVRPDPEVPLGRAELTIETPEGIRMVADLQAGFYVYNNGPGPDDRAMYLTLGTGPGVPGALEVTFFQFLEANATTPTAGTYAARYGALGGDPTMGGNVLIRQGDRLLQLFPTEPESTVTLERIVADTVSGRLSLVLRQKPPGAEPEMVIHGTFDAARVPAFEDLPRLAR